VGHHRGVIARAQVVEHRHLVLEGDQPQPVVPTGGLLDLREQQGKVGLEVGQRAAHAAGVVDDEHDVQRAAGAGVDPGRGDAGRRLLGRRVGLVGDRRCWWLSAGREQGQYIQARSPARGLATKPSGTDGAGTLRGGCARCSGSSCGLTPSGCANKHYDPATHLGEIRSPAPDALCSGRGVVDVGATRMAGQVGQGRGRFFSRGRRSAKSAAVRGRLTPRCGRCFEATPNGCRSAHVTLP